MTGGHKDCVAHGLDHSCIRELIGYGPGPRPPWIPAAEPCACGHTVPVHGCECGDRVIAWWAEVKRHLAESHGSAS